MDDNQDQCDSKAALGLTKVIIDGKRVTAGVAHLRWPWPFSGSVQIDRIEPKLKSIGDNALIAGDFNASTWSYAIKRIARAGGIEVVSGIGPTWGPRIEFDDKPLLFLPTWIGLPIDNVFTKGAVRVVNARTLPWSGSDHRPILVDFVLQ